MNRKCIARITSTVGVLAVAAASAHAEVAPRSPVELVGEASNIVRGEVTELVIGDGDGSITIKMKVSAVEKGDGITVGEMITIESWSSAFSRGPFNPGSSGLHPIPGWGARVIAYLRKGGKGELRAILPNGIAIRKPIPVVPSRPPREMNDALLTFLRDYIRAGQDSDVNVQARFLAPKLTKYYTLKDATKEQVIERREGFVFQWPRRIYIVSGKPRFVQWISEESDAQDEFVFDVRVYQSLKDSGGTAKRGYADHRLAIREKADGAFEITAAEER